MKRIFDLTISLIAFVLFLPVMLIVATLVKITSSGPVIHWSKRVGQDNVIFLMPKFRTMKTTAPQVATHLFDNPEKYLTSAGLFLRKTSLDELPQLWAVIKGDMSLVGPRPALYNQEDLIQLRTERNVHRLKPGITGWAQINGRDELPIPVKVELDYYYLRFQSLKLDFLILFRTAVKVCRSEGIKH